MDGWIKLHRKLSKKGYYKNSQYVHLWVHLLLLANHKEHEYMHGGQIILLREGQLITGRKALSEDTGIPETTIERILKMLENEHQIGQQKTNKYRLVTILNWKEHQEWTGERTTGGHLADTYKNDKKEKKILSEQSSQEIIEVYESPIEREESETRGFRPAKYPNAKTAFLWFPKPELSWRGNTTECKSAELLFLRGEESVKGIISFCEDNKDNDWLPDYETPTKLERNWIAIQKFAKRNGL